MPLSAGYGCLKGRPIGNRLGTGRKPHYQVHISANGVHYRIAVNIQSSDGSEVQYLVRSRFVHPITDALSALAQGRTDVPSRPGGIALDFIRGNLAQPWEFVALPMSVPGPDNDLNEKLDKRRRDSPAAQSRSNRNAGLLAAAKLAAARGAKIGAWRG
jgi:uncharacterized protein YukJ